MSKDTSFTKYKKYTLFDIITDKQTNTTYKKLNQSLKFYSNTVEQNIYYIEFIPDITTYELLLSICGFNVCISNIEGFGHNIYKSLGYGLLPIVLNMPPMNEHVPFSDLLIDIDKKKTTPMVKYYKPNLHLIQNSANIYFPDDQSFDTKMQKLKHMTSKKYNYLSNKLIEKYNAEYILFHIRIDRIITFIYKLSLYRIKKYNQRMNRNLYNNYVITSNEPRSSDLRRTIARREYKQGISFTDKFNTFNKSSIRHRPRISSSLSTSTKRNYTKKIYSYNRSRINNPI